MDIGGLVLSPGLKHEAHHSHAVPRSGMRGGVPPLRHVCLWGVGPELHWQKSVFHYAALHMAITWIRALRVYLQGIWRVVAIVLACLAGNGPRKCTRMWIEVVNFWKCWEQQFRFPTNCYTTVAFAREHVMAFWISAILSKRWPILEYLLPRIAT
jgi:hypothetical protein